MTRRAVFVLVSVFAIHSLCPVGISGDSRWTVPLAESILDRHDTNLDEYLDRIKASGYYAAECVQGGQWIRGEAMGDCAGGHIYNGYPIGTSLLATPFVFLIRAVIRVAAPVTGSLAITRLHPFLAAFLNGDATGGYPIVEIIIASFFVALTAAILLRIASEFLPPRYALSVALIFAFATSAWSTASRALFQHGPSMLLIAITVWILLAAKRNPRLIPLAGLPVAFSYVVRPTNSIWVAAITVYVLLHHRKQVLPFLAVMFPVGALLVLYNLSTVGSAFSSYYLLRPPAPDSLEKIGLVLKAMAGELISPSRGLFVYTPVLLFSIAGMVLAIRSRWLWPLGPYLIAVIALHWIVISLYVDAWYGGYSYGPRLFTDMLPLLMLFLIPLFKRWEKLGPVQILFAIALACSLFIHARGGTSMAPHHWNDTPVSIAERPERLWDWKDPAFLRGLLN